MKKLLDYARVIAKRNGYPILVNGLQPLYDYEFLGERKQGLLSKYTEEWREFCEAYRTKTYLHALHEAADVLYYATQIEEQGGPVSVLSALASLSYYGVSQKEAEDAADVKYGYRVSNPKDEEIELSLIQKKMFG